MLVGVDRRILTFIALAVSLFYGVGFAVIDDTSKYAPIGAVVVAVAWIAVGMLGRDDADRTA